MAQARTETADERRNITEKKTNVNVDELLFGSFPTHRVCVRVCVFVCEWSVYQSTGIQWTTPYT